MPINNIRQDYNFLKTNPIYILLFFQIYYLSVASNPINNVLINTNLALILKLNLMTKVK